jgi:hypothetical protein
MTSFVDGSPYLTGNTLPAAAPTFSFDVSIVGSQFATFFQTVFDSGKPPSDSWPQTGSIAQETERIQNQRKSLKAERMNETFAYSAGSHSVAFAMPGGDLMCGEIRWQSVMTSSDGDLLVQPPDRSYFGQELAPGAYSAVTNEGLEDACWTVTGTGTATPVTFLGGDYSRVGSPTTP